ncbi:MAG: LssY C-terminal domain-containing protein [Pseudomonadota bacterium]|nr:LssY C-terminal domain-containing protein [Pseudomonadota bacterium]
MPKGRAREPQESRRDRRRARHYFAAFAVLLALYLALAYGLVPLAWDLYAGRHPAFDGDPRITRTGDGHPGDPLNVALIGAEQDLQEVMAAAGWFAADRLDMRDDIEIAADSVLGRPDARAPVSSLYLFGRKEDLAFEKPVGDSPRKRNHVRFWRLEMTDAGGTLRWIGAASYDARIGISHTTGQVTHHIAADIDTERDRLAADLEATGRVSNARYLQDFHQVREGRNGGGDPWHTDGALWVGEISAQAGR